MSLLPCQLLTGSAAGRGRDGGRAPLGKLGKKSAVPCLVRRRASAIPQACGRGGDLMKGQRVDRRRRSPQGAGNRRWLRYLRNPATVRQICLLARLLVELARIFRG